MSETFTETGGFIQADRFEQIWVSESENYRATDVLKDNEYLDYKLWEEMNWRGLYKKHRPTVTIIRGKNPNLIFHGGCLGCKSQRLHGFERCIGCRFFRGNCSNPNLRIDGEDSSKMSGDELKDILGL